VREVEYADYRELKPWKKMVPTRVHLNNYRWHYSMDVHVIELDLSPNLGALNVSRQK
jgi:hypothetical protein